MRTRLAVISGALLLTAQMGWAQDAPTKPVAPEAPTVGTVDVGFRGSSTTGDEARFERYRDLQNGVASSFSFAKNTDRYLFDAAAENIGYTDQRYSVNYKDARSTFGFAWDSTPLNYSYLTITPWVSNGNGDFTLDPALRLLVQNGQAIGVPANAAQARTGSIYQTIARPFDMVSRRDTAGFEYAYNATQALGFNVKFSTTKKSGEMPWAASFAFNNANELALPLDNRTNDLTAGMEWANRKGMIRVSYDGSFFMNDIQTLTWDNPLRATDTNPYNASGYSNGLGPARGQMSLAPSNSLNALGLTALYRLPQRTTVNGMVRFTQMDQNEQLLSWTTNSAIINPTVLAQFPHLAHLPRETAEAKVKGLNALLGFSSRPNRLFGLDARYRYNKHDNQTPHFDAEEYVRFDAVPEETGGETEQFDITQNTFDVTATVNVAGRNAVRVGYGYDDYNRTGRSFSDMTDNKLRLSFDALQSQYVTVRAGYDYIQRTGSGFSEMAIEEGGAQPGLRFYDEADRDTKRANVIFTVLPSPFFSVSAMVSTGREKYSGEGLEFGFLNADVTSYNVSLDITPIDAVSAGITYGRDDFSSLQKSRNANPPPDPSWTDPNRDWTLTNDEIVNTVSLYLDVTGVAKGDIRASYDFSDSDNAFIHGGPRIDALAAAGQFIALPNVTNQWQQFNVDYKIWITPKVGLGLGYLYEKFDVVDFATIDTNGPVGFAPATGTPRVDWLGEIMTGYGARPYEGNVGFFRVLYRF
ncbi:MAG: MtrB/PioB family outer membrane beta-barrel protein [Vicinamibacterales bacterium]